MSFAFHALQETCWKTYLHVSYFDTVSCTRWHHITGICTEISAYSWWHRFTVICQRLANLPVV